MDKLKRLLKETYDGDDFDKIWLGEKNKPSLEKCFLDGVFEDVVSTEYDDIIEGLSLYLRKLPMSPIYKQKCIVPIFERWVERIINHPDVNTSKGCINSLPTFVSDSLEIAFVKELHSRSGASKRELSEKLNVSEKTIQTNLRSLCPDLSKVKSKESANKSLNICGHSLNVPVSEKTIARVKYYSTPNTVNPLVLFQNVMQVGVTLTALCKLFNENESEIAINIGVDIWLQLSEYCRSRIKDVFGSKNPVFDSFISSIEYSIKSPKISGFVTEREMIKKYGNFEERLIYCVKGDRICDIWLEIGGEERNLNSQKISISNDGFIAYSANSKDKTKDKNAVFFTIDNMLDILI